jgi:hypothetical protein
MSKPKVHHYVPQFLLNGFVTGSRKQLHAFEKHAGRTFLTPINRAAAESGFNDVDLDSGAWAEDAFGVLEDDAAPVFKRIIREQRLGGLTQREREVVAIFVATQHLRTLNFRETLHGVNAHMATMFRELGMDPSKGVARFRELQPSEIPAASLRLLGLVRELAPMLLAKTWTLVENRTSQPFYVSDNPVAMENHTGGGVGLGVPGVEVSMPLSGSLMLSMLWRGYEDHARRLLRRAGWLGPLRPLLAHRLWPELIHATGFVEALDGDKPIQATADDVQRYNALRVFYANRYVYSGRDDFGLVRDMLEARPELRSGPRLEIG